MAWIAFALLQGVIIWSGIKQEQRAGLWIWSKFVFALGFAALEVVILIVPLNMVDIKGPHFIPVMSAAGTVAALNFIWFIIVCRHWRLPDGRTSREADREARGK